MNNSLLLSTITPCLNRANIIAVAIESATQPDYPNVVHLVIDSGSTDGTLDVLRRYPHLRVVSEPDRKMDDALNKGLRLAGGQVIGCLNTDDCYAAGVLPGLLASPRGTPGISPHRGLWKSTIACYEKHSGWAGKSIYTA